MHVLETIGLSETGGGEYAKTKCKERNQMEMKEPAREFSLRVKAKGIWKVTINEDFESVCH